MLYPKSVQLAAIFTVTWTEDAHRINARQAFRPFHDAWCCLARTACWNPSRSQLCFWCTKNRGTSRATHIRIPRVHFLAYYSFLCYLQKKKKRPSLYCVFYFFLYLFPFLFLPLSFSLFLLLFLIAKSNAFKTCFFLYFFLGSFFNEKLGVLLLYSYICHKKLEYVVT